jgi:hypothetical protein
LATGYTEEYEKMIGSHPYTYGAGKTAGFNPDDYPIDEIEELDDL